MRTHAHTPTQHTCKHNLKLKKKKSCKEVLNFKVKEVSKRAQKVVTTYGRPARNNQGLERQLREEDEVLMLGARLISSTYSGSRLPVFQLQEPYTLLTPLICTNIYTINTNIHIILLIINIINNHDKTGFLFKNNQVEGL